MQLTKTGTIKPKRGHQTDKFQGTLHPTSKLRHGTGTYHYDNTFFTYEGQYLDGKKHGQGALKMKDGTVINGTFKDDQLCGEAQIYYPHGAYYKGNLELGQKSGQGEYTSMFETYSGEWKDNHYDGKGTYKNSSTGSQYKGSFRRGKYDGQGQLSQWNYTYEGEYSCGLKQGTGREISDWPKEQGKIGIGPYQYIGPFFQDKFQGLGSFKSRNSYYCYKGEFAQGMPCLYPNEFRIYQSFNTKNGEGVCESARALVNLSQPLQLELEGDSLNLYIESVYQGPQELDPIQPTQEEIDAMVKNWQNENKKNKNPPPMPDFNQPRMKKPQLELVSQQSRRTLALRILKQVEGNQEAMKVDYRKQIEVKRKENEEIKQEALKKAEQDAGKKGGKKDNKGEPELKVNVFKQTPTKRETKLQILTEQGKAQLRAFQLPDDFPPGIYILEISTPFDDFGKIDCLKKQFNVKAKIPVKKK